MGTLEIIWEIAKSHSKSQEPKKRSILKSFRL
jgi:hypothetical protein